MTKILNTVLNAVYPENIYCICCGDLLDGSREHSLCDKCIQDIHWISKNPFDKKKGFFFDRVLSLAIYDYRVKVIIHDLKLHQKTYIARNLGSLMGELLSSDIKLLGEADGELPYLMMPVPMYKEKEKVRGYNQADLLGLYASKESGILYVKDGLIKVKATDSMRTLSGEKRRESLEGSIIVNPAKEDLIKNSHIILVDDVVTTGTTVNTCAKELKAAGAGKVTVLSFAVVNFQEKCDII